MECIGEYQNGNYTVKIYSDGTKIRENDLDFFQSAFPENIDLKISNRCDMGCLMCHENSTVNGANADLLNLKFINTLQPYTELAIGGGNIFENSQLIPFLIKLKNQKIISNITINQKHFKENFSLVAWLVSEKLVYGIGISLVYPTENFLRMVKSLGENIVIHTIAGILTEDEISKIKNRNLKILFLGYKDFGRGEKYKELYSDEIHINQQYIYNNLSEILTWFKVISFDNLAIKQLMPKRFLTKEQYDEFYMGDDGQFTMYIDAVKEQFGRNSTATQRYSLLDNIDDMFNVIKKES